MHTLILRYHIVIIGASAPATTTYLGTDLGLGLCQRKGFREWPMPKVAGTKGRTHGPDTTSSSTQPAAALSKNV